jgi:AraC-like DNA-binding protein
MKAKDLLTPVDPLGEALHFLRMSGSLYCCSELTAPWAIDMPVFEDSLMFHAMVSGECGLSVPGLPARRLRPGELVLLPPGEGHTLYSDPGVPAARLFDLPRQALSDRHEILRHGGGGAATHAVCGLVRFEHPAAYRLVSLLPRLLCLDADDPEQVAWRLRTLRLMATEAAALRPGGEMIITRLADLLVLQAIRSWMASDPAAQTGWLGALQDKQIGRALALIHRDPARAWTVASLAAEVAMSRSAFAGRFSARVGEPAMQYLARWRMHLALARLQEDDLPLAELASRHGYQSEAAFSRAFKRVVGVSPGLARQGYVSTASTLLPSGSMTKAA